MPTELELAGRLGAALVLGGAIGLERELTGQVAGLRTLRPRNRRTSRHRVWRSRRWVDIGRGQPARLIALGKIIRPPGAHLGRPAITTPGVGGVWRRRPR